MTTPTTGQEPKKESIADILAEMRDFACELKGNLGPKNNWSERTDRANDLLRLADRIKAAEKRERENATKTAMMVKCEVCDHLRDATQKVGNAEVAEGLPYAIIDGKPVAVLHGRVAKAPDGKIYDVIPASPGNAAAMREAFLRLAGLPDEDLDILKLHGRYMQDHSQYGGGILLLIYESILKARKALSAPPRNCDVGDAAEQDARFARFCDARKHCTGCPVKEKWPPHLGSCGVIWGNLPYEAPADGETRRGAASQEKVGE